MPEVRCVRLLALRTAARAADVRRGGRRVCASSAHSTLESGFRKASTRFS
jgi:hypothetical protein